MSASPAEVVSSTPALVRRRSAWSLADQAVSSIASFAVGLLVSREAPLPEIGAFAIAFGVYQLLIAVGRPLNSDPLTIHFSSSKSADQRGPAAAATGAAVALGLLIVPVGVLAGLLLQSGTGWALLACTLFAPVFLLQDAWRYVFLTNARPAHALVSDAVVLVALIPAAVLAPRLAGSGGVAFIAAWGTATGLGAIACLIYSRLWPRLGAAVEWWRRMGRIGLRMLADNLLAMGSYLAALSIIASVSGSDELGRLRVVQVAFTPANFITLALGTIVLAEGSRLAGRASRGVRRLAGIGVTAVAGVIATLAALWLALPPEAAAKLMGPAWPAARSLTVPAALYFGGIGLTMVLSMALRALQATRESLRCRACAAPCTVAAATVGSLVEGPALALLGMGTIELCCAVVMLLRLRRLRAE